MVVSINNLLSSNMAAFAVSDDKWKHNTEDLEFYGLGGAMV